MQEPLRPDMGAARLDKLRVPTYVSELGASYLANMRRAVQNKTYAQVCESTHMPSLLRHTHTHMQPRHPCSNPYRFADAATFSAFRVCFACKLLVA